MSTALSLLIIILSAGTLGYWIGEARAQREANRLRHQIRMLRRGIYIHGRN